MFTFKRTALIFSFVGGLSHVLSLFGATIANSTMTYTIGSIDEISVSGNPGTLTISTATPGSGPADATDSTTTYAITTNNTARKITGSIDSNMPSGTTLKVNLTAPSGGSSAGSVTLSTTSADLVTGITQIAQSGMSITYTLSATINAAPVTGATKTLTYTIGP